MILACIKIKDDLFEIKETPGSIVVDAIGPRCHLKVMITGLYVIL